MKATKVAETSLPTPLGTFRLFGFQSEPKTENVLALVMGNPNPDEAALVRIHSQCLTGDVFGSERCDCGDQLHFALSTIAASGSGLLIYQLQEGRGIGLMNKLRAYELQDTGMDTVEANEHLGFAADSRDYAFAASALRAVGATRVRLLSNNPDKVNQLAAAGIEVVERVPCQPRISTTTRRYLSTKKSKMGHILKGI